MPTQHGSRLSIQRPIMHLSLTSLHAGDAMMTMWSHHETFLETAAYQGPAQTLSHSTTQLGHHPLHYEGTTQTPGDSPHSFLMETWCLHIGVYTIPLTKFYFPAPLSPSLP